MINININNQNVEVQEGTRVLDLLPESEKTNYCVCKINRQIKELRFALTEKQNNAKIQFIGLDNIEGGKAYEASLRLVIAMACHNLYPTLKIRFSYNVSRSIFCQILDKTVHLTKFCEDIKREVNRIISLNLPIERVTVTTQEAIDIYTKYGHTDKIAILKYRPDSNIHLHKIGDYYDYMHGYVVPSTGCLKNYIIRPYSPGLIIQYPRYELNAKIPEFSEESTYGKTLKQAYIWGQKTKTQTIVDINQKIESGNIVDFIQMCETKHTNMLAELGEIIHNASLIHDDIVDKSDVRRGKPTLNSTLGNSVAVLGGDFLISVVLKELLKFNNYNVLRRFSNMFLTLCDGEINQLGEKNQLVSIEKYLEKSEKKTAELFKTILFSVFAVDDLQKHFDFAEKFGKNFGLAFQIRDDVLNYCSKSTDKPVLSDYENGICTLPIIFYAEEKNIEDFCKIKISEVQNSSAVGKSLEVCEKFVNIALDLTADFSDNQYADALKNLCQDLKRI